MLQTYWEILICFEITLWIVLNCNDVSKSGMFNSFCLWAGLTNFKLFAGCIGKFRHLSRAGPSLCIRIYTNYKLFARYFCLAMSIEYNANSLVLKNFKTCSENPFVGQLKAFVGRRLSIPSLRHEFFESNLSRPHCIVLT